MVSWDKAKGKQSSGNSDRRDIQRLSMGLGDTKIRLIGDVMPRYCYWVVTKEGKKMPVECLQFDREKETFIASNKDPFKELDADVYSEKPQFSYVCNVIDRSDNSIKLLDLRQTIYAQIVDYATNPDYGNPSDAAGGYDLTIKKEKTGPLSSLSLPGMNRPCGSSRPGAVLSRGHLRGRLFVLRLADLQEVLPYRALRISV